MTTHAFKRTLNVSLLLVLSLAGALLFNVITSSTSYASSFELSATKDNVQKFMSKKTYTIVYIPSRPSRCNITVGCTWKGENGITNLKSSNSAVKATIGTEYDEDEGCEISYLDIAPRRAGTSKVSLTYKGKKLTTTVKVMKYTNPLKSLKIGKKECKSYFNISKVRGIQDNNVVCLKSQSFQGILKRNIGKTIKATPAKGWKIVKMYRTADFWTNTKIKNGSKIKDTGNAIDVIFITLKNTKTGCICNLRSFPLLGF